MRIGSQEYDSDARLSQRGLANVDDAAFLVRVIARIGEAKTLAASHGSFENEPAAIFVGVYRVRLLVERLFIEIRTVNEYGNSVGTARSLAAVGNRPCGSGEWIDGPVGRGKARVRGRSLALGSFYCVPDTAQQVLPSSGRSFLRQQ